LSGKQDPRGLEIGDQFGNSSNDGRKPVRSIDPEVFNRISKSLTA
jgi:hypothetical protein